jgi:hypothetical protein
MSTIYYSPFLSSPSRVKKGLLLVVLALLSFSLAASAQMVNKDSLSLVSKINSDKEKLVKMQNSVAEKTKEKLQTAEQAQESADDNRKAANKLSNDPQDKKLARKADHGASDARSDAKSARKATDRLEKLNMDIRDLTERIAKNETKLSKYVTAYRVEATAVSVPIAKDSVRQ